MMQKQILVFACMTAFIIAHPNILLAADSVSIKDGVDALKDGIGAVGNIFGKAYEAEIPTSVFAELLSIIFFIVGIIVAFWVCLLVGFVTGVIFGKVFALILFLYFRFLPLLRIPNKVLDGDLRKAQAIETSLFYQKKIGTPLAKLGFYIGFIYSVIFVFAMWRFKGNLDVVLFYMFNPLALL